MEKIKRKKTNLFYRLFCRIYQFVFKLAVRMLPIRTPVVLDSTDEIAAILKKKEINGVLLVTDNTLYDLGMAAPIEKSLFNAGIKVTVFKETQQNPTIENVEDAREKYLQNNCKAIIALGGGSAMDCAKAAAARIIRPRKPVIKMAGLLKILRRMPPFFAVPTTAGTGSEATLAAVIMDGKTHRKFAINDLSLVPHYAVLDPKLTVNLPKNLTAYTGMDALTHAVEAYIGGSNTKNTKRDAEKAFRLIKENMLNVYMDGSDLDARKNMLMAAHYAGRAFTKAYVGNIHAAAHTLSGFYGVQHGLANAMLMPYVLKYYGKKAHKKLSKIAKIMEIGTEFSKTADKAKALICYVKELNAKMGIPENMGGIRGTDLPLMIKNALKEANPLYPVPVIFSKSDYKNIFKMIMKPETVSENGEDDRMGAIEDTAKKAQAFFDTGVTKNVENRIMALKRLKNAILEYENEIYDALKTDLGKHSYEAYVTEVGMTLSEIRHTLKNIKRWTKSKKVKTPFVHFIAKSRIHSEPYGVALIMSPWNYPFLLTLTPLIGAVAAGNCAIVKPSAYSAATSAVILKILSEVFEPGHVSVLTGGRDVNRSLLENKFDYIFFTGSTTVGKTVMEAAAKNLTPVTLELGGKSPCIIDQTANIKLAARRVVWGKFLNSGQTCVAPDYLYIHKSVKEKFIAAAAKCINRFFGEHPETNPQYPKIINEKHFNRVSSFLNNGTTVLGGKVNVKDNKIAPTFLTDITWDDPVMGEEIFGPVLPILEFEDINEIIPVIKQKALSLALYLFTTDKKTEAKVLSEISFGGGCINDTIVHLASSHMPFGGVGASGMGGYHGRFGFDTFSHKKSVLKKSNVLDIPLRYPPYDKNIKFVKMFLK